MDASDQRRLLGLLGLWIRGRNCVVGVDRVREAAHNGSLRVAVLAADAARNSREKVEGLIAAKGIPLLTVPSADQRSPSEVSACRPGCRRTKVAARAESGTRKNRPNNRSAKPGTSDSTSIAKGIGGGSLNANCGGYLHPAGEGSAASQEAGQDFTMRGNSHVDRTDDS